MGDPNDKDLEGEAWARDCDDEEDTYEFDTGLG